jgi:hypothetical protein
MAKMIWETWLRASADDWRTLGVYLIGFGAGAVWMGCWALICWRLSDDQG